MKYLRSILGKFVRKIRMFLLINSLIASTKERSEADLKKKLESIVPDLIDQYSTWSIDMNDRFTVEKIRSQHAFQINTALKAIQFLIDKKKDVINIVDVGDSSGTHMIYLKYLLSDFPIDIHVLSVNLDKRAIEKIKQKGINALLCKAEDLTKNNIDADIFLSYEMVEHLFDPISFLHSIALNTKCDYFVITVPYVRKSRVGLHHLRNQTDKCVFAENTHIFELSPEDWNLIFNFSGWRIIFSDKYTQYPKKGLLNIMKYEWRRFDFDGFYGVILQRDLKLLKLYKDW